MPNPSPPEPSPRTWPWRPLLPPLLAVVICILAAIAALAALGFPPGEVIPPVIQKVLWHQDPSLRLIAWANILQYSTPILLTGLAVTVAFRASVWNIGAQGQYLAGAIVGNIIGAFVGAASGVGVPLFVFGLLISGAGGGGVAAGGGLGGGGGG